MIIPALREARGRDAMTQHAQPLAGVGPFVGDIPEDQRAERVVQMMLDFLGELTKQVQPQLDEAMGTPIGAR